MERKVRTADLNGGVVFDVTSSIGVLAVILIINQAQCLMRLFYSDCG